MRVCAGTCPPRSTLRQAGNAASRRPVRRPGAGGSRTAVGRRPIGPGDGPQVPVEPPHPSDAAPDSRRGRGVLGRRAPWRRRQAERRPRVAAPDVGVRRGRGCRAHIAPADRRPGRRRRRRARAACSGPGPRRMSRRQRIDDAAFPERRLVARCTLAPSGDPPCRRRPQPRRGAAIPVVGQRRRWRTDLLVRESGGSDGALGRARLRVILGDSGRQRVVTSRR